MALITEYITIMNGTIYGATIKNAMVAGMQTLETATESNTARVVDLESDLANLTTVVNEELANITLDDPSSAELVACHTSGVTSEVYTTIGLRLDDMEQKAMNLKANLEYDITDYGGDKTGATASDDALEAIIALLTDGCKVVFPFGTYLFEDEHEFATDVSIDFNNSTIVTDVIGTAFKFTGTLKTTKTGAADYVETTSKNCLVLNSITDIAAGDLLNVISTELYDTSRDYYYKGGNVLVTKTAQSAVYFDMVFPFNMTAATITANIYDPIKVNIKNLNMVSIAALADAEEGIQIIYGANCTIENCKFDNYQTNLDIYRCVNVRISNVTTKRAKATTADGWDGYGVAINSSTNVVCDQIITNSGQHGITTTGREPSYRIALNDCVLKAEIWGLGLGCHGNTVDISVSNSTIFGFLLTGSCFINNCIVPDSEIITQNVNKLIMAESARGAQFSFKNCDIANKVQINDSRQLDCPTRKYIGKIVFDNCPGLIFESSIKPTSTYSKVADIESLEIVRCTGFVVDIYDRLHRLVVTDSEALSTTSACVNQKEVDGVYELIDDVFIARSKFPLRYGTVTIRSATNVVFDGFSFSTLTAGAGTGCISVDYVDTLTFSNCDMSNAYAERGIEPILAVNVFSIINSKVKFRTQAYKDQAFFNALVAFAAGAFDVETSTQFDVRTASNGNRYYVTIDGTTGAQVLTQITD